MLHFRRAIRRDSNLIAALLGQSLAESRIEPFPLEPAQVRQGVQACLTHRRYCSELLMAVDNEQPVACSLFQEHHCDLTNRLYYCASFFVAPTYRRTGIASDLQENHITEWDQLKALLAPQNEIGIAFGQRLGLKPKERWLLLRDISEWEIAAFRQQYIDPWGTLARFSSGLEIYEVRRANHADLEFIVGSTCGLYHEVLGVDLHPLSIESGIAQALENTKRCHGVFYVLTYLGERIGSMRCFTEFSVARNKLRCYLRRLFISPRFRDKRLALPFLKSTIALFSPEGRDLELRALLTSPSDTDHEQWLQMKRVFDKLGFQHRGRMILME